MKKINPDYKKALFKTINESAFPTHVALKMTDIDVDSCRFVMEAAEFRLQPFGAIHGGNLAILIDSATFWAVFFSMGNDQDGLTSVDLKLNYLGPVFKEQMTCEGRLKKAGKRLFYAEADVWNEKGDLVAHGASTLIRLPGKGLNLSLPMFA